MPGSWGLSASAQGGHLWLTFSLSCCLALVLGTFTGFLARPLIAPVTPILPIRPWPYGYIRPASPIRSSPRNSQASYLQAQLRARKHDVRRIREEMQYLQINHAERTRLDRLEYEEKIRAIHEETSKNVADVAARHRQNLQAHAQELQETKRKLNAAERECNRKDHALVAAIAARQAALSCMKRAWEGRIPVDRQQQQDQAPELAGERSRTSSDQSDSAAVIAIQRKLDTARGREANLVDRVAHLENELAVQRDAVATEILRERGRRETKERLVNNLQAAMHDLQARQTTLPIYHDAATTTEFPQLVSRSTQTMQLPVPQLSPHFAQRTEHESVQNLDDQPAEQPPQQPVQQLVKPPAQQTTYQPAHELSLKSNLQPSLQPLHELSQQPMPPPTSFDVEQQHAMYRSSTHLSVESRPSPSSFYGLGTMSHSNHKALLLRNVSRRSPAGVLRERAREAARLRWIPGHKAALRRCQREGTLCKYRAWLGHLILLQGSMSGTWSEADRSLNQHAAQELKAQSEMQISQDGASLQSADNASELGQPPPALSQFWGTTASTSEPPSPSQGSDDDFCRSPPLSAVSDGAFRSSPPWSIASDDDFRPSPPQSIGGHDDFRPSPPQSIGGDDDFRPSPPPSTASADDMGDETFEDLDIYGFPVADNSSESLHNAESIDDLNVVLFGDRSVVQIDTAKGPARPSLGSIRGAVAQTANERTTPKSGTTQKSEVGTIRSMVKSTGSDVDLDHDSEPEIEIRETADEIRRRVAGRKMAKPRGLRGVSTIHVDAGGDINREVDSRTQTDPPHNQSSKMSPERKR